MTVPRSLRSLHRRLEAKLQEGSLEIPILPEVARRVISMTGATATSGADLAKLIHRDQALAAQVLRGANSVALAGSVRIVSLQQAVTRLGMSRLAEVAVATSVQGGLFDVPEFKRALRDLWRHSFASALFGREIARSLRRSADTAFLCGLLHGIGKPLVYGEISRQKSVGRGDPTALAELVDEIHASFGLVAADRWGLPPAVAEAIAHSDDYEAAAEFVDEAAITFLADRMATHVLEPDAFDAKTVRDHPVFASLNLYPEAVDELLAEGESIRESVLTSTS